MQFNNKKPTANPVLVSQTLGAVGRPGKLLRLDDHPFPWGKATPQTQVEYKGSKH